MHTKKCFKLKHFRTNIFPLLYTGARELSILSIPKVSSKHDFEKNIDFSPLSHHYIRPHENTPLQTQ